MESSKTSVSKEGGMALVNVYVHVCEHACLCSADIFENYLARIKISVTSF